MTGNTYHIVQHLFNGNSPQDVSVKQIEGLCDQYPFFSIGHYLLSKKLSGEKAKNILEETKKTALYFNNPFWLQWLLENGVDELLPEAKKLLDEQAGNMQSGQTDTPGKVGPTEHSGASPAEKIVDKTPTPGGEELLFSPYHTVDYFGSLGIKLILDDSTSDKFGK